MKKKLPMIMCDRQMTENEVIRYFKIYKNHTLIIESIDGGKTYKREDYIKK